MGSAKIVFFDAAGTLMHIPKGVGFHYAAVARRHGLELDAPVLERAFRAAWKVMPPRAATRAHRTDDDRGWWRGLVEHVLDGVAPDANLDRDAFFSTLYQHFAEPGVWELFPEAPGVLTELRAHCALGVLSNFDGRLRAVFSQLGILPFFDVIALSSEIGADKPDPFIFEEALRRAGVAACEAVHVGDDPIQDWEGAAAVGMRCFRLTRPEHSLLELPAFLALEEEAPAAVVTARP